MFLRPKYLKKIVQIVTFGDFWKIFENCHLKTVYQIGITNVYQKVFYAKTFFYTTQICRYLSASRIFDRERMFYGNFQKQNIYNKLKKIRLKSVLAYHL